MQLPRTRTRLPSSSSPGSPAWVRAVKQLDFYYKSEDDVMHKRSKWGGITTIILSLFLLYLVLSEVITYFSVDTVDVLTVDTRRGEKLPIHIDIIFPSLSCMDVAVDVVEASSGETLEEAAFQIIKERRDYRGKPFAEGEIKKLGSPAFQASLKESCPPCVPDEPPRALLRFARSRLDQPKGCCMNCAQVRDYLRMNHLPQALGDMTPQCKIEAPWSDNEGCRVHGFLEVPRGKGDFHIAAGAGLSQQHEEHQHHLHQVDWGRINKFNITHTITSLSFGPQIPNMVNPLDNHKVFARSLAQHIYIIQVIPTTYNSGRSEPLHTNQYSYTQHHQRVDMGNAAAFSLPGVYFRYDINPLMIHIQQRDSSFANFLTRICAIIGGLYVVFGIVYSLTSKVVKTTTKKAM